ncbi:MAG: extracellular solute-binding protein [Oscillospiraceae bacterium]|nr:extracellular solute-binding protein [Oscillospiraceae bacterium]
MRKSIKGRLAAMLLSAAMFTGLMSLTACDGEPEGGGTTTPAVSQTTPNTSSDGGAEPNEPTDPFEGLTGEVNVYMPSPPALADALAAGFEDKTGVKVNVYQGTTGEILARLEAEAANPIADVVILASWSDGLALREEGGLLSYTPRGADKMHSAWVCSRGELFGMSASAVGVLYNTTLIPELSADWHELAEAQFKDMTVFPDPERSGSAKDFLAGHADVHGDASLAIWKALAENGMTVPGANGPSMNAVVTGERAILVAGVDWNAYTNIASGEPLAFYYPAGGTVINPRPAMILETSKNDDNAKAFMDYLLTDEAQQLIAEAYLLPGRSDFTTTFRPNVSEMNVLDVNWDAMMENATSVAQAFNELIS